MRNVSLTTCIIFAVCPNFFQAMPAVKTHMIKKRNNMDIQNAQQLTHLHNNCDSVNHRLNFSQPDVKSMFTELKDELQLLRTISTTTISRERVSRYN